jgi:hypothetical protein
MTSEKTVSNTTAAPSSSSLISNSDDDTSWIKELPPVEASAPGDALYDTLEDFVLDQSEGENSSVDGAEGASEGGDGDAAQDTVKGGAHPDEGGNCRSSARDLDDDEDDTSDQASRLPATTQSKSIRARYTTNQDMVLYLLRRRGLLGPENLTKVFNHMFRAGGVVREQSALANRLMRHNSDLQKRFADPDAAGLAVQKVWKQKMEKAVVELSL